MELSAPSLAQYGGMCKNGGTVICSNPAWKPQGQCMRGKTLVTQQNRWNATSCKSRYFRHCSKVRCQAARTRRELALERRVPTVLDGIVRAAGNELRNTGPLVAVHLLAADDHGVLPVGERALADLRIEVVPPPAGGNGRKGGRERSGFQRKGGGRVLQERRASGRSSGWASGRKGCITELHVDRSSVYASWSRSNVCTGWKIQGRSCRADDRAPLHGAAPR